MKRIHVHKFGTDLMTTGEGIDAEAIKIYAKGLIDIYGDDQIIFVGSGAVEAGKQLATRLHGPERAAALTLQQHAAIGQAAMFRAIEEAFAEQNVLVASTGITHAQLGGAIPEEKKEFDRFIWDNGVAGLVTDINEADTLSVKELMKRQTGGENDGLAAHMAWTYGAYSLHLWKEMGGFFDDDKQLIDTIGHDNIDAVRAMAEERAKSTNGRGGISAGIDAGWEGAIHGVPHVQMAAVTPDMYGKLATNFVIG